MKTWTRLSIALISAALVGCRSFSAAPPKDAGVPSEQRVPVIQRVAEQPVPHTHSPAIRTTPKILSFWVPSHVSDERLIDGHAVHIEVEQARWWTQAVRPEQRPVPTTVGPMLDRHRSRSARSLWNVVRRGGFVPWTTGGTAAPRER